MHAAQSQNPPQENSLKSNTTQITTMDYPIRGWGPHRWLGRPRQTSCGSPSTAKTPHHSQRTASEPPPHSQQAGPVPYRGAEAKPPGGNGTRVRRPSRDRHPHTGGTGLLRPKQNKGGRWFLGGLLSRTSTPNGTDFLPLQRVLPYLLVRLQQVTLWSILFIGDHQGTGGVQSINIGGEMVFWRARRNPDGSSCASFVLQPLVERRITSC